MKQTAKESARIAREFQSMHNLVDKINRAQSVLLSLEIQIFQVKRTVVAFPFGARVLHAILLTVWKCARW